MKVSHKLSQYNIKDAISFMSCELNFTPMGLIPTKNLMSDSCTLYIPRDITSNNSILYGDSLSRNTANQSLNSKTDFEGATYKVLKDQNSSLKYKDVTNSRFTFHYEFVAKNASESETISDVINFFFKCSVHNISEQKYVGVLITSFRNIFPKHDFFNFAGLPISFPNTILALIEDVSVSYDPLVISREGNFVFTNLSVTFTNLKKPSENYEEK